MTDDTGGSSTGDVGSACGNGVVEGDEDCDDGNTLSGDGCPWHCRLPSTMLAVGKRHACVAQGPTVRCWGDGAGGRHGSGTIAAGCTVGGAFSCAADPSCCLGDDEPPSTGPTHRFEAEIQQIAAGSNTCVVYDDGRLACWGPGYHGVLGPAAFAACGGTTDCSSSPQCCIGDDEPASAAAVFDFGMPVRQVAVGAQHACVLLEDDTVHCWGAGTWGRLGYGDELAIGDDEPVTSAPAVELVEPASFVTAGELATCAALTDGRFLCWGACAGPDGVDTACLGRPGLPGRGQPIGDDELPVNFRPLQLEYDQVATDLGVGAYHACVVGREPLVGGLSNGYVFCWGDLIDGAIGTPTAQGLPPRGQQREVLLFPGADLGRMAVASSHSCATFRLSFPDGFIDGGPPFEHPHVACWGRSTFGATGYGTTEHVGDTQEVWYYGEVQTPPTLAVDVGDELSCALTIDEEIYCWGAAAGPSGIDGAHGHPGLGNIGDDETPMDVGPVSVW